MSDNNIPHAARMINQFRVEEGAEGTRKHFVSTGKVMCWCNCGTATSWLDLFDSRGGTSDQVKEFFKEHQIAEEIGVRMGYVLGELADYGITESGIANPALTLYCNKDDCNWSEDIDSEFLTDIVLKILNNKHICKGI